MTTPAFDRPIAHRGLHDRAAGVIENSAAAFERAIEAGYHIECDLQLSSEGVPIVFHDDDLERLTGHKGRVDSLSADELTTLPLLASAARECPQRFTTLLSQVAGRTLLQVELKQQPNGPRTEQLARAAVAAIAGYNGPLVLESFDPGMLVAVRRAGYRGALGIITYRYDQPGWDGHLAPWKRFVLRNLLHFPWTRFDFMSVHNQSLDMGAVRFFRHWGKPVTTWTIRSQGDAALALAHGADQIVFEGFDANAL